MVFFFDFFYGLLKRFLGPSDPLTPVEVARCVSSSMGFLAPKLLNSGTNPTLLFFPTFLSTKLY